ncbi:MAG: isocitrate dehydrogenase (NADP(+)) [Methanobacteriota archaeon]|nr:MAG: isocitrate dehydrogenase (NADP(+)) [Euryarchaeota archaeon]
MPTERFRLKPPTDGHKILIVDGHLKVPDDPIVPIIEGDGIGPDVTRAARRAISAAVDRTYSGRRRISWCDVPAGEVAMFKYGELLPPATLDALREYVVGLKGPLTTPIGGGFRSLNVALRQALDLYSNTRPVYWIPGVPSPMVHPERMNIVIFREATEDVYAGIEWQRGSEEAKRLIGILAKDFGVKIPDDAGIGLKPISEFKTKRLVRKAIRYAIENHRRSVALVHKGNIMKYTEGAFREWGYEVARQEFPKETVAQSEVDRNYGGAPPKGKVVIKDVVADNMFQQLLTRTEDYDVLATPNLNGDYLSDAAAAQVGGLGVAPGGNIGDAHALFEPIHGTAPKYAGMDKVNPTAEILAGVMMLEYLGWREAGDALRNAVKKTIGQKIVTYDLARQMEGAKEVKCSEYAEAVVRNL